MFDVRVPGGISSLSSGRKRALPGSNNLSALLCVGRNPEWKRFWLIKVHIAAACLGNYI